MNPDHEALFAAWDAAERQVETLQHRASGWLTDREAVAVHRELRAAGKRADSAHAAWLAAVRS